MNQYRDYWIPLLSALIDLFTEEPHEYSDDVQNPLDDDKMGYQNVYSKLIYATTAVIDPLEHIDNEKIYLAQALAKLSQSRPGELPTMISALKTSQQGELQQYCANAGVQIV